jgi:hypothetical protein
MAGTFQNGQTCSPSAQYALNRVGLYPMPVTVYLEDVAGFQQVLRDFEGHLKRSLQI